jgi:hypothetical protein
MGHQHVGMQRAVLLGEGISKPLEIGVIGLLVEETGLTIVAPPDDVQGSSVKVGSDPAGPASADQTFSLVPFPAFPILRVRRTVLDPGAPT